MTLFFKYYLEIRNRLLLIFIAWTSLLLTCYYFKESLLFIFVDSNQCQSNLDHAFYYIFTDISEIFQTYLRLVLFITNQITVLISLYHTLMFITLGLYHFEYFRLNFAFQVFLFNWFCSLVVLKEVIMPFSWSFFLSFQDTDKEIQPALFFFEARIMEYLNYFINSYYLCVTNFQILTLVILTLNKFNEESKTK